VGNGIAFVSECRAGDGRLAEREDARVVERGGLALGEGGEGIGRCEEELGTEAVVCCYLGHLRVLCGWVVGVGVEGCWKMKCARVGG